MPNVYPPKWLKAFKYLRPSLKKTGSIEAFDLLLNLIEKKKSSYGLWTAIGVFEGFITILEHFSRFNTRGSRKWRDIHSDEVIEGLINEIRSHRTRTLE